MQQAIAVGNNLGMLIAGIILLAVCLIIREMQPVASRAISILLTIGIIIGVILIVVWFILFLFSFF